MRFRAELCHVDTLRCVVRVEAWNSTDHCLGSRLGEAANAEEAEDRARQRLLAVLSEEPQPTSASTQPPKDVVPTAINSSSEPIASQAVKPQLGLSERVEAQPSTTQTVIKHSSGKDSPKESSSQNHQDADQPSETPSDPEDWSEELTAIDFEMNRIGWGRDQEKIYLERAFGHAGRHRLTRYADLVAYLRQLRQLQVGDQPEQAIVPIRRGELISQGDQMLRQLGWSGEQARGFLQQNLQAKSRQQLSDEQLLQFNMLLEGQIHSLKK